MISYNRGSIRISSLSILTLILVLQLFLSSDFFLIDYEKGIELVRSKGYRLVGDVKWQECIEIHCEISEVNLREFMSICERHRSVNGSLTVYTDYDEKVIFLILPKNFIEVSEIFCCRFR